MQVEEKWINYHGSNIRYWVSGKRNKDTLIFFHGWPGYLLLDSGVIQQLAKYYFVITVQHPGLGKSDPLINYYNVFEQNADVALDILLQAKRDNKKVIVMGQSFGGPVASAFAYKYPEHTKALVMTDSLMGGDPLNIWSMWVYFWLYGGPTIAKLAIHLPKFILKPLLWEGMGVKLETREDWDHFYKTASHRIALVENYGKLLYKSNKTKVALIDKKYADFPVLMVWGDRDGKEFSRYGSCNVDFARILSEKMGKYNKRLKFITVSGGHTILYQKPKYVIDKILENLAVD